MITTRNTITKEQVEEAYVWGLGIVAMYRYYGIMGEKLGGINQLVHSRVPIEPGQFWWTQPGRLVFIRLVSPG
jgi:hypothetical protein